MGSHRWAITINFPNLRIQSLLVVYIERTRLSPLHAFADLLCALKRPTRYTTLVAIAGVPLIVHTDCDLNALVTKKSQAGLYHEACSKKKRFSRRLLARTWSKGLMLPYLGETVKLEKRLCILSIGVYVVS